MTKQPLVSVLLPVGKERKFLKQAVESIKKQSYKSIEFLLGEDKGGEGITKTLNKLAKKAKGEFLARMDADDISQLDRIEKQVKFLMSNPEVMLVGSWATLIDESGKKIGLQKMPGSWEEIKKQAFYRNPFIHPSWMMKKKWFLERNGYNESYRLAQDWEFTSRWVWNYRMENIPETLIKLRLHPKSVSFRRNSYQVMANLFIQWQMLRKRRIEWWRAIILIKTIISWFFPAGIKFKLQKKLLITDTRSGTRYQQPLKTLGIVLPMGQSRKLLEESGQWSLWESELVEYRKVFNEVELFKYRYTDWRRFIEALILPFSKRNRFKRCSVLKAVHLSGAMPCLIAKWLYGVSYVLSYGYRYDEFARLEGKWGAWLLVRLLTPPLIKFADAVMAPTEGLKDYILRSGTRNVEVIPNGVDVLRFTPKIHKGPTLPRPASPRGEQGWTLLYVGRLERQKNLENLITAVSELDILKKKVRGRVSKKLKSINRDRIDVSGDTIIFNFKLRGRVFKKSISWKLFFVGSGSLKGKLITLARKLNVDLQIKKPVANEKLPEIYRGADIFVLPSLIEGHPKALLEAMSCRLACLASNIGGVNEIILDNKNGLLVKPTAKGIRGGLERLVTNRDLREKLGKMARKTVLEKFDKKKLMEKECRLLLNVGR